MFQQPSKEERKDVGHIRDTLYVAFATDPFVAYNLFVDRCLNSNKSVDVYLADLRRLSTLYRGVFDHGIACTFVTGLPDTSGSCFVLPFEWMHWMSTSY